MRSAKTKVRQHLKLAGGVASILFLGCCGESAGSETQSVDGGSASDDKRCFPAAGTTGNPRTIHEVLDLINGLPQPLELPCFLESLDRPLSLNANSNIQSAQPAQGKRSPRIFIILNESLSMSLVPGADPTLEFGERSADVPNFSVKGEVHFPIADSLTPEDAFSRLTPDPSTGLTLDRGTSCGVCHDNERPAPNYPFRGAFTSAVVRPQPFFAVGVSAVRQEHDACDAASEPERCAVLDALFDHGDVVQMAFP